MATFAQASFNASSYGAFRPTYPPRLISIIVNYHSRTGKGARALDLGCGTGQVTTLLPRYFESVIGADPSKGMIDKAKEASKQSASESLSKVQYFVSAAETIASEVEPNSVDLITAGQAAHWFDQSQIWPELLKVLKPGGTVAFWVYSEMRVIGRPDLTPLIDEYSHGAKSVGPFWQQPGRRILEEHLKDVPFPSSAEWDASSARRIHFASDLTPYLKVPYHPLPADDDVSWALPDEPEFKTDVILQKQLSWEGVSTYLRTWSSLHSYHQAHPEDLEKKGKGKDGDIVDRFVASLKEKVPGSNTIDVAWPVTLLMIKKASINTTNTNV